MSYQYIKKNRHKNEGVFVLLKESEELSENLEKEENEDDSVEDWNKVVSHEKMEIVHDINSKK